MTKRYTAIVEIVELEETSPTRDRGIVEKGATNKRELARFVVRDEDLANLKVKLGKHVELV